MSSLNDTVCVCVCVYKDTFENWVKYTLVYTYTGHF